MAPAVFHLIPHTHWDREWYLARSAFAVRLARMFDELLPMLEAHPALRFTLDGQTVLVEDYLAQRPAARDRIARAFAADCADRALQRYRTDWLNDPAPLSAIAAARTAARTGDTAALAAARTAAANAGAPLVRQAHALKDDPSRARHLRKAAIIADVAAAFDRNYDYFKGLKERMPPLNPDNTWKLTRAVLDHIGTVRVPTWRNAALTAEVERLGAAPVTLDFQPITARFIQSRPRFKEDYIAQAYETLVERAKRRILIANAYFVPSRALTDALGRAAARGVDVTIVTNSPASNDIAAVAKVSRWLYRKLLDVNRAGAPGEISIYEWRGPDADEGTLHAKVAVFDDDTAIVGSYNLDPRSERLNSETAVALRSPSVATVLARRILEGDLPKCRRIEWSEAADFRRPDDLDDAFELLFSLPLRSWL